MMQSGNVKQKAADQKEFKWKFSNVSDAVYRHGTNNEAIFCFGGSEEEDFQNKINS